MRAFAAFLLAVGAAQGQGSETSQTQQQMLLHAEMEAKSVKLGSPVYVKLRLTGLSSRAVRLTDTWVPAEYELVVTDASGKELPRTPIGEAIRRGEFPCLKCETVSLDLFEETGDSLDLREIYEFNEPGTYSLRATRRGWTYPTSPNEKTESVSATSDIVQFTITP